MMKLSQLVKVSSKARKMNAEFVKIVGYKEGRNKKGFAVAIAKSYSPVIYKDGKRVRAKDTSKYVTRITFVDSKLNVKASCSCPDYLYRWEYANNLKGAADLLFGNGEAPVEKNPSNKPGLCKHLLRVAQEIKERHPTLKGI